MTTPPDIWPPPPTNGPLYTADQLRLRDEIRRRYRLRQGGMALLVVVEFYGLCLYCYQKRYLNAFVNIPVLSLWVRLMLNYRKQEQEEIADVMESDSNAHASH